MKKLNLILFLVSGIMAYAQPSITRAGVDRINSTITLKSEDVTGTSITAGPAGANVTWDFSGYTGTNTLTITTKTCPGQSNCFRFPTANRIAVPAGIETNDYTLMTDTEATMLGSYSGPSLGDVMVTYVNPLIEYKFPITYLQQFDDTYEFNSVSAAIGNTNDTGQVSQTVDAYGTIITPTGTYNNVLRIKRIRTATQIIASVPAPITATYTNESYQWVSQTAGPVFSFAINTFVLLGNTNIAKTISYLETETLSTIDLDSRKAEISVYPNPSTDYITLRSKEEIKKVIVSSLEGKIILNAENSRSIDVSKFPKGVYILRGEFKNGSSFSKKIIKK
ncbi:T9SS C-terminal target domain-containing protein [Chryseobacterium joostei]|uniref:Por secretion system C-terminal sorting domain-containing protein n=1 Tax=Chryseobacterium joostei TaxID=112234 RepID=A0A1N7IP99_9FLAO|nr:MULTISPECIES: T9SS type A sorting domain-containing protein [Chryseobacterium]AZA98412.1 T9SS C-terminal target domain-containing protein [Chryseobacterium joostei]SIS38894.1 Por secretion system C-terminal sorting domain-containing protein [Chryseobacterium joostei]HCM35825.1 T9SS C-terminal target domain-containing protein [Chryseobacterium sp.]